MDGFAPGDRVELVAVNDEHTCLTPGGQGTVTVVDDLGTVHIAWDSGSRLVVPTWHDDAIRLHGGKG